MGKVMSLINTTPDGFADGKYAIIDAEFFEFTHGLLLDTAAVAFGRSTFELFQSRWPPILEDKSAEEWQIRMAGALNNKHKTVFSSTLKTTTWSNSAIIQEVDAGYVNVYKQQGSGGLLTFGSLGLVASLTEMNLIDDYYFCIQPVIAGGGDVRLFDKIKLDKCLQLKYIDSTLLKSGVHIIHYQNAN